MRSTIILSGIAALSLIAVGAQAQTTSGPAPSPGASPYASPAAGAPAHAAKKAKHGYNARARDDRTTVMNNYAQTTDRHSGNDAGNLVPFRPPQ
jgi:hypothetical protein